jgi:two-component system response regulator AtoC
MFRRKVAMSIALLIAQDQALFASIKDITRSRDRLQLEQCETIAQALARLQQEEVLLTLIHADSLLDESEVADYIGAISKARPTCPTLILSNEYRNQQAIAMLRAGAADYFGLPQDLKKLAHILATKAGGLPQTALAEKVPTHCRPGQDPHFYVLSPEMIEVMDKVRRVITKDATLLLTGETGTGKTRLARYIHECSPRCERPFLVVDCGALAGTLIESEMFGHIKGSFTGADRDRTGKLTAAGEGTLLLDEINALPLTLQSKLLRAVDERLFEPVGSTRLLPLKARIIVASSAPLDQEVRAGRFRADLFYRLNVVGFHLPPLRERPAAIAPLANKFLAEYSLRNGRGIHGISHEALEILIAYDWPGNIRELRNVMERAVALAAGQEIQLKDLPPHLRSTMQSRLPLPVPDVIGYSSAPRSLFQAAAEAEHARITQALLKHKNNRLRAAAELGISRMALYKKLQKYGLRNP